MNKCRLRGVLLRTRGVRHIEEWLAHNALHDNTGIPSSKRVRSDKLRSFEVACLRVCSSGMNRSTRSPFRRLCSLLPNCQSHRQQKNLCHPQRYPRKHLRDWRKYRSSRYRQRRRHRRRRKYHHCQGLLPGGTTHHSLLRQKDWSNYPLPRCPPFLSHYPNYSCPRS